MKKQFWIILFSMLIINVTLSQAQWRITTTQGNVYRGIILNQDNDVINLKTLDNTELTLKREIVESTVKINTLIQTKSGEEYVGFVTAIDNNVISIEMEETGAIEIKRSEIEFTEPYEDYYDSDNLKRKNPNGTYSTFGITVFVPGLLNLSYSHSTDDLGVRLCAGTLGNNFGWQVNTLFNLKRSKNYNHNLSLGMGMMITNDFLWYGGVFYDINVYGLFLEFGIATSIDKDNGTSPTIQVGYLWEF